MKIVFVASIIRHEVCMIYVFFYFSVKNNFLTRNYFLTSAINLTTWSLSVYLMKVMQCKPVKIYHLSGSGRSECIEISNEDTYKNNEEKNVFDMKITNPTLLLR